MSTTPPITDAVPPATDTSMPEPRGAERANAMSRLLARNWGWVMLRGVLALAFGVLALLMPITALASLALVFGAYMLADGIVDIVAAVRAARRHERWGLLVLEGVLDIIVGLIALLVPPATIFAFVILTAAWAVVTGGLMVASAVRLRRDHGRWWLAIAGIVSIVWGVLLVAFPGIGAIVLAAMIGAYAVVFGVLLVVLAMQLRRQRSAPPATPATAARA